MRKTKKQLVQRILQLLENKPMTRNELSEKVGSNWDTIENALGLLKSVGLIMEVKEGNKKIFKKAEESRVIKRNDTLLGIPITTEAEELCKYLFLKVKERWLKKTKEVPNKTQMQKVIAEITETVSLPIKIPCGWYLFGKLCILEYDPEQEYFTNFKGNISNLSEGIDKAIEIYINCKNAREVLFEQYQRKNKLLYLARLKLQQLLSYEITQENKQLISKLLHAFIINFSRREDNREIISLLDCYVSIVNQILLEKSGKELGDIQNTINDCFISLWELLATYNLFDDLVNGDYGYEYEILKKYFDPRNETLVALCKEYLAELNSSLSIKPVDKNSQLFKLMGSTKTKILTEDEKKRLFEDYEQKDISNVFGELNLN